jgi:hypothetical protein
MSFKTALMSIALLLPAQAWAVEMYDNFPQRIRPGERYVIYSHGLIVEGDNARPVHAEFGVYDFPAISAALFKDGDFNLIAHHRPANTSVPAYVDELESWVRQLIAAGVSPADITLVGFSRGAQLTAEASSRLRSSGINTVLMGVCLNGDFERSPAVVLGGRLLSVYETSDVVGSCAKLAQRSQLTSFEEVAISTGRKHGAFFQPRAEWMTPLKDWLRATAQATPCRLRSCATRPAIPSAGASHDGTPSR